MSGGVTGCEDGINGNINVIRAAADTDMHIVDVDDDVDVHGATVVINGARDYVDENRAVTYGNENRAREEMIKNGPGAY